MPATSHVPNTPFGLPRALFWDARPEGLDPEKHQAQIIGRVVELGGLEGWRRILNYYGEERLRDVVIKLRTLEPRTINFLCVMLNLKKEDFRCCTSRPFPPAPWIY